ncbi:MAG: stage III sporulation protein AF [Firmicutes bacterium]|nr:stage III sporulation protein AF [Bacillota bacterium]
MLATVSDWVRTLVVVALLGNLLEWVLPDSSLRRHAGLVVGLVLLLAILGPFARLFGNARAALTGAGGYVGGGAGYGALIREEEAQPAAALLEAYPGGTAARVQSGRGPGAPATVAVRARRPPGPHFRAYVAAALAAATGRQGRAFRLQVLPVAAGKGES